jgi:hypothetical protein
LSRDILPIYDGAIKANRIGAFVLGGETFYVTRPGYCSQGKRRSEWTQIVHEGIPIYEVKLSVDMAQVISNFETSWKRWIGDDRALLGKALTACKKERRKKFRDEKTGVEPAPTFSRDSTAQGLRYPA